jgi:CheY-like chemotaxis protein
LELLFRVDIIARVHQRLLCVDDSLNTLAAYDAYLSGHGFLVTTTTDPHIAIRIAIAGKIDLAILDYSMPIMDGGQLSAELKRLASFPIIIVSGDVLGIPEHVRKTVDRVVSKLDGMRKVLEIVQTLLLKY